MVALPNIGSAQSGHHVGHWPTFLAWSYSIQYSNCFGPQNLITLLCNKQNKKASIRCQDSAPPISGYWPTSEPNAGYHDFPLTGSNFGNLTTAFRTIFSHILTAHAQERPFMNFRLKF